jgi:large subunit ribosomal protein L33
MAKKGEKRVIVGLVSEETGERIYYTTKNKQNTPEKLSFMKYSRKLRRRTLFVETKKNLGRNEVKPKK